MKKIDKSFKNQQEIFAWLAVEGNKIELIPYGYIIGFKENKLYNFSYDKEYTEIFFNFWNWQKVFPTSWEDFLEEYDLLAYVSDYENLVEEKTARIDVLLERDVDDWKDIDNCSWTFAKPVELSDFEILEGKWLGRKKEKECSTE